MQWQAPALHRVVSVRQAWGLTLDPRGTTSFIQNRCQRRIPVGALGQDLYPGEQRHGNECPSRTPKKPAGEDHQENGHSIETKTAAIGERADEVVLNSRDGDV